MFNAAHVAVRLAVPSLVVQHRAGSCCQVCKHTARLQLMVTLDTLEHGSLGQTKDQQTIKDRCWCHTKPDGLCSNTVTGHVLSCAHNSAFSCRYDEISLYDYGNQGFSEATGKFSGMSLCLHSSQEAFTDRCISHVPHMTGPAEHLAGVTRWHQGEGSHLVQYLRHLCDCHAGHFTQMVWKSTARLGCAVVSCPNGLANWSPGRVYMVCRCALGGKAARYPMLRLHGCLLIAITELFLFQDEENPASVICTIQMDSKCTAAAASSLHGARGSLQCLYTTFSLPHHPRPL